MKRSVLVTAFVLAWLEAGHAQSNAPSPHPWLDQQLKKQRVACPPGKSPFRGPADAPVTIVQFGDFDCPGSQSNEAVVKKILAAYPTQVKFVFKNLPLVNIHPQAKHKAVVAECMGIQGLFWQAHDRLLAGVTWDKVSKGADQGQLKACVSQGGKGQVDADLALAKRLGLATTPSYVIDGIRNQGMMNFGGIKMLVDSELARKAATTQ